MARSLATTALAAVVASLLVQSSTTGPAVPAGARGRPAHVLRGGAGAGQLGAAGGAFSGGIGDNQTLREKVSLCGDVRADVAPGRYCWDWRQMDPWVRTFADELGQFPLVPPNDVVLKLAGDPSTPARLDGQWELPPRATGSFAALELCSPSHRAALATARGGASGVPESTALCNVASFAGPWSAWSGARVLSRKRFRGPPFPPCDSRVVSVPQVRRDESARRARAHGGLRRPLALQALAAACLRMPGV